MRTPLVCRFKRSELAGFGRLALAVLLITVCGTSFADKLVLPGATKGDFQVTPGGAAVYSVPIQVPKGTAGLQPAISLQYSSQSGPSEIGLGWSVAGLSSISRGTKNILEDGIVQGVALNANDTFLLDGQKLVSLGDLADEVTEYRTFADSYSKVRALDWSDAGPSKFISQTKGGLTLEFGGTEDSRVTIRGITITWLCNKITDSVGNYIRIEYDQVGEGYTIVGSIHYSGNDALGLQPYASVTFEYERVVAPFTPRIRYHSGTKIVEDRRLVSIESKFENEVFRRYDINAEQGLAASDFLVEEIAESGERHAYRPTKFEYTHESREGDAWVKLEDIKIPVGFGHQISKKQAYRVVDVDRDGWVDILYSEVIDGESHYSFQKGSSNGWTETGTFLPPVSFVNEGIAQPVFVKDVTGDSRLDVIDIGSSSSRGVYEATDEGFVRHPELSELPASSNTDRSDTTFVHDLNADGRLDLVYLPINEPDSDSQAFLNMGSEWSRSAAHDIDIQDDLVSLDSNCDGVLEVGRFSAGEGRLELSLFESAEDRIQKVDESSRLISVQDNVTVHKTRVTDLNGDGCIDVILSYVGDTGSEDHFYIASASGWIKSPSLGSSLPVSLVSESSEVFGLFINLNADDKSDLIIRTSRISLALVQGIDENGDLVWRQSGQIDELPIGEMSEEQDALTLQLRSSGAEELLLFTNESGSFLPTVWELDADNWKQLTGSNYVLPVTIAKWNSRGLGTQLIDLDNDGLQDMVAGNGSFRNTGNGWVPFTNGERAAYVPPRRIALENGGDSGIRIVDINGDLLPDFIYAVKEGDTTSIEVHLNNGLTWVRESDGSKYEEALTRNSVAFTELGVGTTGTELIDLNGDGLADIISSLRMGESNHRRFALLNDRRTATWVRSNGYIPCVEDGGICVDLALHTVKDVAPMTPPPSRNQAIQYSNKSTGSELIDLNADSLPDILFRYRLWNMKWTAEEIQTAIRKWRQDNPNRQLPAELSQALPGQINPLSREVSGALLNTGEGWTADRSYVLPYRLDGEQEETPTGQDLISYTIDHNSDGLIDIHFVERRNGKRISVALTNTGTGFVRDPIWNLITTDSSLIPSTQASGDFGFRFVDVNGDTRLDIVQHLLNENGTENHKGAWINTGLGWAEGGSLFEPSVPLARMNRGDQGSRYIDLNGDGLPDLAQSLIDTKSNKDTQVKSAWRNNATRTPLLSSISDGQNNRTNIRYETISYRSALEERGIAYVHDDQRSIYPLVSNAPPANLVRSTWITIPGYRDPGEIGSVTYSYSGFKVNLLSGRPAGFAEYTERNSLKGSYRKLKLQQECSEDAKSSCMLIGKTTSEETGAIVNGLNVKLQEVSQNWQAWSTGVPRTRASPSEFWSLFLKRKETIKYSLDGDITARLIDQLTYDFEVGVGNVGSIIESESKLVGEHKTVTTNLFEDNAEAWLMGRLTKSTTTRISLTSDDQSRSKTACFSYYPNGLLESETSLCGHTKALRTEHKYDGWGNRTSTIVSASDIERRQQSSSFDSKGRLVQESTNELGHKERILEHDHTLGLPIVVSDANDLKTLMRYDDFGRIVFSKDDIGIETTVERRFAVGGCRSSVDCHLEETTVSSNGKSLPVTLTIFDSGNREVRTESTGFGKRPTASVTVYNATGDVERTSNTYFADSPIELPVERYDLPPAGIPFSANCASAYQDGGLAESLRLQREATASQSRSVHWSHYFYDHLGRISLLIGADGSVRCTDYGTRKTTKFDPYGRTTSTFVDSERRPIRVINAAGGELRYEYDLDGRLRKTVNVDGSEIEHIYNDIGEKVATDDPDLGLWQYKYNSLGELVGQTDAKNQVIHLSYDLLGRLKERVYADAVHRWEYDESPNGIGFPSREYDDSGFEERYEYDKHSRPQTVIRTVPEALPWEPASSYRTSASYDEFGRQIATSYSSGFGTLSSYDDVGLLRQISATDKGGAEQSEILYEASVYDAEGRIRVEKYGSAIQRSQEFEGDSGNLVHLSASKKNEQLQNLSFEYDLNGNLVRRGDLVSSDIRANVFDKLDRLIEQWTVTNFRTKTYDYAPNGDLTRKSDFGDYEYNATAGQPLHGLTRVVHVNGKETRYSYDANGSVTSRGKTRISYNNANQAVTVSDSRRSRSTFAYSPSGGRYRHDYIDGRRHQYITYFGGYERIKEVGTEPLFPTSERIRQRHSVIGPNGLIGTVEYVDWIFPTRNDRDVERRRTPDKPVLTGNRTREVNYILSDNLGTANVVLDEYGTVKQFLRFDAWGARIYGENEKKPYHPYRRGFTGHEHLDNVSLIHMNGRLYDASLGRFLSADPNIQSPGNAQNYNRYSYVLNNPYKYVDPSGYFFKKVFGGISKALRSIARGITRAISEVARWVKKNWREIVVVAVAIVVTAATGGLAGPVVAGMIGGFAAGASGSLLYGGSVSDALSAGFRGAAIGGMTAGLTSAWGGVGGMADGLDQAVGGFGEGSIGRALGHGAVGGVGSEMQGGEFMTGFGSAAFTHYASSAANVDGIEGFEGEKLARVSVDAAIGGTASVLGGGKFANGAMSGAFQRLYNAEPHREFERQKFDEWVAGLPDIPQDVGDFITGFGDAMGAKLIRGLMGNNVSINSTSGAYSLGSSVGTVWGFGTMGGLGARGMAFAGRMGGGTRWGHWINHNRYLRFGPGRMPQNGRWPSGPKVPRMSVGPGRRGGGNPHLDLRFRPLD